MIEIESNFGQTKVKIDGVDIGSKLTGLRIAFYQDCIPQMYMTTTDIEGLKLSLDKASINIFNLGTAKE